MDLEQKKTFVSFVLSANRRLRLTDPQLSCLIQECLEVARYLGDISTQMRAHDVLCAINLRLSRFNEAMKHNELLLDFGKQIGAKIYQGRAYGNLGNYYYVLGLYGKALQYHKMHLDIAKQIGNKEEEGRVYCQLGLCYKSLGQYAKAIDQHNMSLEIAKTFRDKTDAGRCYSNLGVCYKLLGKYDKAIHYHEMFQDIAKQTGDKAGEALALGNIAVCYKHLRQYTRAINMHNISLSIAKQIEDRAGEQRANGNLGICYFELGEYHKAIDHYKVSLSIAKETGAKSVEQNAYGNIGRCYEVLRQYDKAIHYQEMSLSIAKESGDKAGEGRAYRSLGSSYFTLKQYEKAEINSRESLRCFEELFSNVPNQDQLKISFHDTYFTSYAQLIRCLLFQDKSEEALITAERGRAKALAELMFTSFSVHVHSAELTEVKVSDIGEIRHVAKALDSTVVFMSLDYDIARIYTWVTQPNGDAEIESNQIIISPHGEDSGFIKDRASLVENDLNSLIRRTHGKRYTAQCEDRSLSFLYSEEMAEQTNGGTLTSGNVVVPEMEKAPNLSFVQEAITNRKMKFTTPAANPVKADNWDAVEEESGKSREENPLKLLYMLLSPVRHLVKGSRVVISVDGPLALIPFAALVDENGNYLGDSLQVRLIPSLATAKMITEYPLAPCEQGNPLIVGDPDAGPDSRLPCANKEARMVGDLFNIQPLIGKDATKEKFLQELESASLIHIAAHGDMKRGEILLASPKIGTDEMESKKKDKVLMLSDLEYKRLRAKLVVLSCCNSANGEVKAGEVIGISRAFLGAGARSVLVALWAIDDEATLFFMREFYKHLTQGLRANESLNKAMASLRKTSTYCHPRHWAPFVLIGDDVKL